MGSREGGRDGEIRGGGGKGGIRIGWKEGGGYRNRGGGGISRDDLEGRRGYVRVF